nr:putative reverse transcriptase domain, reverse transcriptase zinc-binding domain protein [Tanacetum cinerariifolium]
KRGFRQGDHLPPYLFTLVIEILTLILKRRVRLSESFRYHRYCEEIQLINVCFVDDLFIFARVDVESSRVIMDSLKEFKLTLGLIPSIPKSTTYFCNVLNHTKASDLGLITCLTFVSLVADLWKWRDRNGNISSFFVAKAWEAIRSRGNLVAWSRIVWFSHNIPRHAFHLWYGSYSASLAGYSFISSSMGDKRMV